MNKLNFIIAGVQKGGTSAIWHFLRQHPAIGFGRRKEMHFFDNEALDWDNPPYDVLHNDYGAYNEGILLGDATPIYTYWPNSLLRIYDYNPSIKLIVSLRDPVERAYSHWRMEVSRGAETLPFCEAIREGRKRVLEQAEVNGSHRVFSYVERGFYIRQLDELFELFEATNVLLLRQSELQNSHVETLDKICNFLSIEQFRLHPSAETIFSHGAKLVEPMKVEDAGYLRDLFAADVHELQVKYGVEL